MIWQVGAAFKEVFVTQTDQMSGNTGQKTKKSPSSSMFSRAMRSISNAFKGTVNSALQSTAQTFSSLTSHENAVNKDMKSVAVATQSQSNTSHESSVSDPLKTQIYTFGDTSLTSYESGVSDRLKSKIYKIGDTHSKSTHGK